VGISPLFIEKAKGCQVWDIDGNKYVDLVSSLASVTLGYGDARVDNAVRKQLRKGVTFSLPGTLEAEVAEMICELVPSAEMVRFGKNGTDATSAAVRLARAYTGKDRILVCGYHGWQDWFIGSTSRNKGVPESVANLTETFKYNDLISFREIVESRKDIACVIMEPMNSTFPAPGFLEGVREITKLHGIVLVFDETITGFRFSEGGAQAFFNVTPDLSTFGKGIANGFPLSVITGKREIMMEMEEVFFSGTFGGELLSLAAAKVVLQAHIEKRIVRKLIEKGDQLKSLVNMAIDKTGAGNLLALSGHPTWKFLNWSETQNSSQSELKTLFMQEMFRRGVLILGTHNINVSMQERDLKQVANAYYQTLELLVRLDSNSEILANLKAQPLQQLFKVR